MGLTRTSFHSDRSWNFDVGQVELWDRICATDAYDDWWPWLRGFDAADGLVESARWTCTVAPPLPYTVRFHVHLDRVEAGRLVEATVSGDIAGTARLTIESSAPSASSARLVSALHPTNPLLRGFGIVARPMVEFGHNWILDQGRRQFVERAFG